MYLSTGPNFSTTQVIDLSTTPHTHTTPSFFVMELVEWQMKSIRSLLITTFPASMLLVSAFGQVWIPCEVQKMHKFLTKKNLYNPRNQLDLKQWFFLFLKGPKVEVQEWERKTSTTNNTTKTIPGRWIFNSCLHVYPSMMMTFWLGNT